LSANKPQTCRDEYSQAAKIIDAEYQQVTASLDGFIKTCQKLHVEEQHQLIYISGNVNVFLMEHYEDSTWDQ
jgi:hypothetical protein